MGKNISVSYTCDCCASESKDNAGWVVSSVQISYLDDSKFPQDIAKMFCPKCTESLGHTGCVGKIVEHIEKEWSDEAAAIEAAKVVVSDPI